MQAVFAIEVVTVMTYFNYIEEYSIIDIIIINVLLISYYVLW